MTTTTTTTGTTTTAAAARRRRRRLLTNYFCFTKQQRFYSLFVQTRTPKHKKAAFIYIHEQGSKKFHCSSVQLLWVAHLIIALSGDIEENPGPFTETNNDKVLCSKSVNTVSLLESRLLELGRLPVNVLEYGNCFFSVLCHASYITPLIISIYAFLEFSIFCITLSYISKVTMKSWQNYVNNMARQRTTYL